MDLYPLLRQAFFRLDPERAHTLVMALLRFAHEHPGALRLLSWTTGVHDPRLAVRLFGLDFPNPFGLAAGFDKNGEAAAVWPALGFGHAEVGSVTALAQPGNPKPRAFRLPSERAIINRMGFNNQGAAALAARLRRDRARPWWPRAPLVVNVGKSRAAAVEDASADYRQALVAVWAVADIIELNVSSPNTPGLRTLQDARPLSELLALASGLRDELGHKPILLKVAPDLNEHDLDDIVSVAERHAIDGLVATNTTVRREMLAHDPNQAGGLSGAPLGPLSLAVLRGLRARTHLPLVASGGIFNEHDVRERLIAGASLVQLYTGWIYQGPLLPRRLAAGVRRFLAEQGAARLQDYLDQRDARH